MIGQILTRMASVLLLPFYTHVLTPADYGVTAILDLLAALLATFIAGGMISAVTRHHFDGDDTVHQDRVWWTGLSMVGVVCTIIAIPMLLGRQTLADLTLGKDVANGAWFYTLTIFTMWFTVVGMILDAYLRVMKWSGVFVAISLGRLILNVSLNVWLLVSMKMGVEGLLIGNLAATVLHTAVLMAVFIKSRGGFKTDSEVGRQMIRFASPLVITALASMMMHEADRYFLRIWESMEEVGIYSLAHKIGFAINTLCLLPFISIWHVAIYDIERMPDSNQVFGKMFGWFTAGLGILLLGAALVVYPILPMLTPNAYAESIELISVVLLGFYAFGLSFMFEVPSMLSKRTRLMLPGSIAGLVVNVCANMLLIPLIGSWGAAWAGILTYVVYSFTILYYCRKAIKIDYPWTQFAASTTALIATYVGVRYACFPYINAAWQIFLSVAVCAFWAVVLFGREGLELLMERLRHTQQMKAANAKPASAESETAIADELVGAS
jgi:O-antigen/teichoic acid export membrane protein